MAPERRRAHWIVIAFTLVGADFAHAEIYVCKGPSGNIRADQPPPECADRQICILRPDGSLKRCIDPPPTPEQRKKRDEDEKRKLDEEDTQRNQRQSDRSLLETYSSGEEIEAARKRALADLQIFIDRAITRKAELQRERKKLDNETEFFAKRDMPEKLKRDLAANNESMKSQDRTISDTKAAMARANQRYDGYANRFKELLERGATPVQRLKEEKTAPK